jgi:hypothetical protein
MHLIADGFFRGIAALGPGRIGALAWVASGVAIVAVAASDLADPKADPNGVTVIHTIRRQLRAFVSAAYGTPEAPPAAEESKDRQARGAGS